MRSVCLRRENEQVWALKIQAFNSASSQRTAFAVEVHSVVTKHPATRHLSWGRGTLSAAGNATKEQVEWRGLIVRHSDAQTVTRAWTPCALCWPPGDGGTANETGTHTQVGARCALPLS